MNCWACRYQQLGGEGTFLGLCTWFRFKGKAPQPIPVSVVDDGCKFYKEKENGNGESNDRA